MKKFVSEENFVTSCYNIFAECVRAIRNGELIQAVSASDKEFHFQNWFQSRLLDLKLDFDELLIRRQGTKLVHPDEPPGSKPR